MGTFSSKDQADYIWQNSTIKAAFMPHWGNEREKYVKF